MWNTIDLIGRKFGRLTVVGREKNDKNNRTRWICHCDCGTEKIIYGDSLRAGRTKSCGCYRIQFLTLPNNRAAFHKMYTTYKWNAKQRNIVFDITEESFRGLCEQSCFYCGAGPHEKTYQFGPSFCANGVDRVDSKIGYVDGNCVSCCRVCNKMKMDFTIDEFIGQIRRIYNHFSIHGDMVYSDLAERVANGFRWNEKNAIRME